MKKAALIFGIILITILILALILIFSNNKKVEDMRYEIRYFFEDTLSKKVIISVNRIMLNFDFYGGEVEIMGEENEFYPRVSEYRMCVRRVLGGTVHGFMDENGEIVIKPKYKWVWWFTDGVAKVVSAKEYGAHPLTTEHWLLEDRRRTFIDINENVLFELDGDEYVFIEPFCEGFAAVLKNGSGWGYIDKTGGLVIPAIYANAYWFKDGVAQVCFNNGGRGEWALINGQGDVVQELDEVILDMEKGFYGPYQVDSNGLDHRR